MLAPAAVAALLGTYIESLEDRDPTDLQPLPKWLDEIEEHLRLDRGAEEEE